ncbi:hypothetical protein DPMN_132965 [Dreissena polymorpha]|uniref:Uncharacterized protein n=1 Tax=Dreissena polymorpha TaxID=45954 RepID=A0A9D4FZ96_DREPO|nr:hypothetical protein DPMN_132965 [Dreissena polymorpha]
MKILDLLMEIKQKNDKSEETLSDVCKQVVDLENSENCYDLQGNDEEYVDYEPDPCSSKRSHDKSCQDANNNETVTDSRFSSLAKRFKEQEVTDKDIDTVLASNVTDLFRKGMEEDQYMLLLKDEKLARPANCDGYQLSNAISLFGIC